MVEGMLSLKKVLQSSDTDVLQSIPSVLDVAEAVIEIEARKDILQQLCSQSIADHDIEGIFFSIKFQSKILYVQEYIKN